MKAGRSRWTRSTMIVALTSALVTSDVEGQVFLRGDANGDGRVSWSDFLCVFDFELTNKPLPCERAADANADGHVDIFDRFLLLRYALGVAVPCAPFPVPGEDRGSSLPCDDAAVRPPLEDPEAMIRIPEVTAGPDGRTTLNVFVTNSMPVSSYFVTIGMEGARFGEVNVGAGAQALLDGKLRLGFLSSTPGKTLIPPGDNRQIFTIDACLEGDLEPGLYPIVIEDGEFVDFESNQAILPETEAGDLEVTAPLSDTGCVSGPAPEIEPECPSDPPETILRGDANHDGTVNITDAVALLNHLFAGSEAPSCADEADANDDGAVDIADAIAILSSLFDGGVEIPPPFPDSGADPTDDDLPGCLEPAGG